MWQHWWIHGRTKTTVKINVENKHFFLIFNFNLKFAFKICPLHLEPHDYHLWLSPVSFTTRSTSALVWPNVYETQIQISKSSLSSHPSISGYKNNLLALETALRLFIQQHALLHTHRHNAVTWPLKWNNFMIAASQNDDGDAVSPRKLPWKWTLHNDVAPE